MDRPRLIRSLRIAVSAVCGILCVLLVVMWVRSYRQLDWLRIKQPAKSVASLNGRLHFNDVYNLNTSPPRSAGSVIARRLNTRNISLLTAEHDTLVPVGVGRSIPYWPLALATVTLTALPWVPARFSLRTLLIATTLIAVVLGFVVYATR